MPLTTTRIYIIICCPISYTIGTGITVFFKEDFVKMGTFMAKKEDVIRKWYIVDAKDQILGRIATKIAAVLRGKHKAIFTPHVDTGDYVIVINAEKVKVSGKKADKKLYQSHSGQPGGFREEKFSAMIKRNPVKVIQLAVRGMLPKTRLGDAMFKKLKIYKGDRHPHGEIKPTIL
jgi:large subunit ribosomal protein L13